MYYLPVPIYLIKQSDQIRKEQFSAHERLQRTVSHIEKVCKQRNVSVEALKTGSRRQKVVLVRTQLAKTLVDERGLSLTEAGRHLGVSASGIAKILYQLDRHKSSQSRASPNIPGKCYWGGEKKYGINRLKMQPVYFSEWRNDKPVFLQKVYDSYLRILPALIIICKCL